MIPVLPNLTSRGRAARTRGGFSLLEMLIGMLSVIVLALMAAILSICSEADAFVAASFTSFSPTAKLAFMVVGPMVDLKLIAMQAGVFGRSFAVRFAPLVFGLAVLVSLVVGSVLLGSAS